MTDKKDFIEKHVSKWMVDDGNNKLLWKDKAPTVNEVLDFLAEARAEGFASARKNQYEWGRKYNKNTKRMAKSRHRYHLRTGRIFDTCLICLYPKNK